MTAMSDHDPVDAMAPWTIKSVSKATRDAVTAAARREGLTVGQWLERRVAEWEGQGSPVSVTPSAPAAASVADLAHLMHAALAVAEKAGVPVPPTMARDAFAAVRHVSRQARGATAPRPRQRPNLLSGPAEEGE
jgi:hypothetical protein